MGYINWICFVLLKSADETLLCSLLEGKALHIIIGGEGMLNYCRGFICIGKIMAIVVRQCLKTMRSPSEVMPMENSMGEWLRNEPRKQETWFLFPAPPLTCCVTLSSKCMAPVPLFLPPLSQDKGQFVALHLFRAQYNAVLLLIAASTVCPMTNTGRQDI